MLTKKSLRGMWLGGLGENLSTRQLGKRRVLRFRVDRAWEQELTKLRGPGRCDHGFRQERPGSTPRPIQSGAIQSSAI